MKKSVKFGLIIGGASLILGLAGLFWYFGMTNNKRLIAKIPKDSTFVFKADVKALADKSEFKKWKDLDMFSREEKYEGDEEKIMKDLMKNPKKSGINFLKNAYGFMRKGEEYTGGMVFGINDAKDFEETVQSLNPDLDIQKNDGIYSTEIDKGDVALVWDKNEALLYFSNNENIVQRAKEVFTQDEDNSMLDDETFMEFDDLDADLGFYGDMKQIRNMELDAFGKNEGFGATLEKLKGFGVTVLFEDEQLIVDAIYYPEENATAEDISMMKESGLSNDLLKLMSPVEPKGYYAVNFNLEKLFSLYPQINEAMMKDGFSFDEMKNGLTGEITFALIDVKNVQTVREVVDYDKWDPTAFGYSPLPMKKDTTNEITPIYKLNFGVKDRGVIDNMIAKYVAKMNEPEPVIESFDIEQSMYRSFDSYENPYEKLVDEVEEPKAKRYQYNNLEVLEMEDVKFMYKYDGNYLSISNDESAFNPGNFTWNEDLEEMITSKPGSGYIDLDYKNYPDIERENPRDVQRMKEFLLMLDNASFSSDGMNLHFELNFTDSPDHILWRLMKAIDAQNSSSAYN